MSWPRFSAVSVNGQSPFDQPRPRETRGGIRQELAAGDGAARGASRNSLKLAEQTRSCDYDPCDEGGEAREQQQIMQDDGHGKCPYAAAGTRTNIWAGI